jgi:outer membrane protein assembly factor BamD (BamD/ComL family)
MLLESRKLISEGNFDGALKENERVMSFYIKEPPGDQAMYNMGLIYAHYMNPGRDLDKSLMYFEKVIDEHPQSPLAEQAKIWVGLLKKISMDEEYFSRSSKMLSRGDYQGALKENRKVLSLYNTASPGDQALFNIGLVYAHYGNPDKDYLEAIQYFEKLIQKYPGSPLVEQAKIWVNVLNIIEKVKQVDIEIDKKKKELTR